MSRLAIAVCLLFAWANSVFGQTPAPSSNAIVTQGEAIVKRPPDRAWLTVATEARDPRAEEARKRAEDARAAEQRRQDSALLQSFTTVQEIDMKRDREIHAIEIAIANLR